MRLITKRLKPRALQQFARIRHRLHLLRQTENTFPVRFHSLCDFFLVRVLVLFGWRYQMQWSLQLLIDVVTEHSLAVDARIEGLEICFTILLVAVFSMRFCMIDWNIAVKRWILILSLELSSIKWISLSLIIFMKSLRLIFAFNNISKERVHRHTWPLPKTIERI